jgi:hypothetical protein
LQLILRRWVLLEVFYTESGAYPRASLAQGVSWQAGPLYWVTSPLALHAFFCAAFVATAAFTAGFGTRYVKWLLLPALVAIDARPPLLFTGGEAVLHGQAIYCLLLPISRVWSVDAWLRARRGQDDSGSEPTAICSPFYVLLLVQLAVIYLFNALAKFGPSWHDGTAVARALGTTTLVTDFGGWVLHWPAPLLHGLTHATRVIEGTLPLLLLSPWRRRYTHAAAGALMLALHGGIFLAMEVGSFSAAMLCYLPLLWHPRGLEENAASWKLQNKRLQAAVLVFLVYVIGARLSQDLLLWPDRPILPAPRGLTRFTRVIGFLQPWMMFSPDPPARDFIVVTDAVTRSGRHFDPWRAAAGGPLEPLEVLPRAVEKQHVFARYEDDLATSEHTYLHPFFARWVLAQRSPEGEPVERFDAWLMIVSTLAGEVIPAEGLEAHARLLPLPFPDALRIKSFEAEGVWAPERAFDRKIAPEATYVLTPVGASMSAGCPHLTLDLGEPRALKSAYIQADAFDHFLLDASLDGKAFHQLAEMPQSEGGNYHSRIVELPGETVRFVRVRPFKSRGMSQMLSEIAFFDHLVTLPALPEDHEHQFVSALNRPAVAGIISGSNHPSADCPAENIAVQFATAPKP